MSNDLEKSLRQALRPVDPGEAFTRKVMSSVEQGAASSAAVPPPVPVRHSGWRWASAALAVALLTGLTTLYQWQLHRQERGLAARRQLIEALHVTSEKLDVAYRVMNDQQQTENGS